MQLDFLRALSNAQHGLTHAAARKWFEDAIAAKAGGATEGWDPDALLSWLLNQSAITLDPDGNYRLTDFGRRVVAALGLPGLFIAPKAI
jgi:hypothetical protein